jgi:WD40 repeat protein
MAIGNDGLKRGWRVRGCLVVFMSAEAFGSDWAALEARTVRFRDRRFLPVRLDDSSMRGSLEQLSYVDWRPGRAEAAIDDSVRVLSLGHTGGVNAVAFSPDGRCTLSGSAEHEESQ